MNQARESKAYHKAKYRLFFAGLILDVLLLSAFFFGGFSVALRDFSAGVSSHFAVRNGVYITIFVVLLHAVHFPLRWFEGLIWEHRFKLSNQSFPQWLADDLKKGLVNLITALIAMEGIYLILRKVPETWWLWAGAFWLLLTLGLARLTPNVIIPLFYKYSPIENDSLKNCVLKLFQETRIAVRDAYLINFSSKTKKANAFICGLGRSRRVVLSDTLVNGFTVDEIETVIAHEIGHYKHHDILKLTVINAAVVFLGFFFADRNLTGLMTYCGISRIDDIAFFPIVALAFMVLGLVVMPLLNGYSRRLEVAADRYSLSLTKKPKDFISMIHKLGEKNLADFEPHPAIEAFFYSHPSISKRIVFAQTFLAKSP